MPRLAPRPSVGRPTSGSCSTAKSVVGLSALPPPGRPMLPWAFAPLGPRRRSHRQSEDQRIGCPRWGPKTSAGWARDSVASPPARRQLVGRPSGKPFEPGPRRASVRCVRRAGGPRRVCRCSRLAGRPKVAARSAPRSAWTRRSRLVADGRGTPEGVCPDGSGASPKGGAVALVLLSIRRDAARLPPARRSVAPGVPPGLDSRRTARRGVPLPKELSPALGCPLETRPCSSRLPKEPGPTVGGLEGTQSHEARRVPSEEGRASTCLPFRPEGWRGRRAFRSAPKGGPVGVLPLPPRGVVWRGRASAAFPREGGLGLRPRPRAPRLRKVPLPLACSAG